MNGDSDNKPSTDASQPPAAPSGSSLNSPPPVSSAPPAASPAVDDAPLPFSLKTPGSDESVASAPKTEATSPATVTPPQTPSQTPPSPSEPPSQPAAEQTKTVASAKTTPPPAPPKFSQTPKEDRPGFFKNIFKRNAKQDNTAPIQPKDQSKTAPSAAVPPPPAAVSTPPPSQTIGKAAIIKRPPTRAAIILEIFAALIVAIVAIFFIFFYRAQIKINPTPAPDIILLDQNIVKAGLFKVKPGTHSIEIKKDGYVTYRLTSDFKINQKLSITMQLIRATDPQTVLAGASEVRAAQNNKLAYFLTSDGQIASVASQPVDGKFQPFVLTNGTYKGAKNVLYSADNTYALVQLSDSIKIVSFKRPDTINQVEALLPLNAAQISSVSWNAVSSDYVNAVNSQIVYDKNDGENWDLIQSDVQNSNSSILMTIDPRRFATIFVDWGANPKKVLIAGGELGVLDLGTRIYEKINENINFKWGIWGPQGKYAVVVDENGDSYVLSDLKVKKLDLKTAANLISWVSPSKAIIVSDGRPIQIDFDTNSRINYAEINSLKGANSFAVIDGRAVFADNTGVKIAPLTENIYKK